MEETPEETLGEAVEAVLEAEGADVDLTVPAELPVEVPAELTETLENEAATLESNETLGVTEDS